jgi:hypothetical protein
VVVVIAATIAVIVVVIVEPVVVVVVDDKESNVEFRSENQQGHMIFSDFELTQWCDWSLVSPKSSTLIM